MLSEKEENHNEEQKKKIHDQILMEGMQDGGISHLAHLETMFLTHPLRNHLKWVPGLWSPTAQSLLHKKHINNAKQLVGWYFLMNRNQDAFQNWLINDVGLPPFPARSCASMLHSKLKSI